MKHPLQTAREQAQHSRAYLADRLHIAESTIARIENGQTLRPHPLVRGALSGFYGIPEEQLFPSALQPVA